MPKPKKKFTHKREPRTRINMMITASEVFLIGADGKPVGNVSLRDALAAAREAELDLVEISPNAKPPVVKVLDFGKYKYDQTKAKAKQKANSKESEVKEVRLGVRIGEHDLEVKAKMAERFLKEKNKVKASLVFKGREIVHQDLGKEVLINFVDRLKDIAKMEQAPTRQGRSMYIVLAPTKH